MKKSFFVRTVALALVAIMMLFAVGCDMSSLFADIDVDGNGKYEDLSDFYNQVSDKITLEHTETEHDGKHDKDDWHNDQNHVIEKPTDKNKEPIFDNNFIGDLDFEGEEVAVLYRDYIANSREWYKATPEDELDDAVAMRNEKVQETLNLKIVWEPVASNGNDYGEYTARFHTMVMQDVTSGTHYYDISANFAYPTVSLNIRDYATNLLDTSIFPYFDFSLPCWNQSIVENTTCNDQLYYVAGDINLSMFDAAVVVWHNKSLYDEKKEAIDPENIQQLALDGLWTYDELYRWTKVFYENSSFVDVGRDENDTYALLAAQSSGAPMPRDAFPYAWDLDFTVTNNDGTHSFNIVGNRKIEEALTKCRNLLRGTGTYNTASAHTFAAGNAIFYMERMYAGYDANMAIREMEDRYALLPMPKYNSDQKQYATTSQDYYTIMFVLDHSYSDIPTKGDAVSAFLQYASEVSYTQVRGYYFNRIIKPKFFGTDDSEGTVTRSIALFDIIVANIKFDYCYIYSQQLANVNHLWRAATDPTSTNANASLESLYRARQSEFEQAIKSSDAWFGLG